MLTDSQCRTAKCKDKPYKLTDAKGLYLEWHRALVRGQSKEAAFLRWLVVREWNRLSPGAGYVDRS